MKEANIYLHRQLMIRPLCVSSTREFRNWDIKFPLQSIRGNPMLKNTDSAVTVMLLAAALIGNIFAPNASSQNPQASPAASQPSASPSGSSNARTSSSGSPYHPTAPLRARDYYQLIWGVDSLTVRSVESGELIRFNYRVVDATKAQALNDKKSEPVLIDPRVGVKLVVPSMEKVGQLRQSSTPEAGKIYWMAFSNKGGLVKRGDQVTVVIGKFRADGLIVE